MRFLSMDSAPTQIYTLSLHDALPISYSRDSPSGSHTTNKNVYLSGGLTPDLRACCQTARSEEHTSELQSPVHLVCRLLLEKKKKLRDNKSRHFGRQYIDDRQADHGVD